MVEQRERTPSRWQPACGQSTHSPAQGTGSDARAIERAEAAVLNGRPILEGELINARDLGGTALGGSAVVPYGVLYRGPPLAPLSERGCLELAELGVRTIIDLRIASEREIDPEAECALEQASLVLAPLPVPYNVSTADYIADLNATESIAEAFRALGEDAAYPAYLHCTWGRDRSGVLAALILLSLGATREAVMQEYRLSEATVGAYPDSLDGMLDELECQGGIAAYLDAAGVSADQLATLRAHAAAPSGVDSQK